MLNANDPALQKFLAQHREQRQAREQTTESTFPLTPAAAQRLTDNQWRRAYAKAVSFLNTHLSELQDTRTDGLEIGAELLFWCVGLQTYSIAAFAAHADPRNLIREKTNSAAAQLWHSMKESIVEGVNIYQEEMQERAQAELATEREQMTHAANEAQIEATRLRRELDALRAQQAQQQAAHAAEVQRLRDGAARERDGFATRERSWNEERRVLVHDRNEAQQLAARLAQDVDRVTAELEVLTTPPPTALERASLCLHARQVMDAPSLTQDRLHEVPDYVRENWQRRFPTRAAQLAHVRTWILPILRRADVTHGQAA